MVDAYLLEPIAARAWRAAEQSHVGGWRLYASAGFSGRINACWPLEPPDRPLDQAIAVTEAWYAARGLKPVFKIVDEAAEPAGLTERLKAMGYAAHTETFWTETGKHPPQSTEAKSIRSWARCYVEHNGAVLPMWSQMGSC